MREPPDELERESELMKQVALARADYEVAAVEAHAFDQGVMNGGNEREKAALNAAFITKRRQAAAARYSQALQAFSEFVLERRR